MCEDEPLRLPGTGETSVSLSRFAVLVGITYVTARSWAKSGKIETLRIGGIIEVPAEEVLKRLPEGLTNYDGKGY